MIQNPNALAIKQFIFKVLENKTLDYDELLTRIGVTLVTNDDLKKFGLMVNDIMGVGYRKAMQDNKKQLNDMGIQVIMKD